MNAKWGMFMTEQKKNTIITSGIAVLAVILAYCFRIVGRGSFYPMLFSYLRSFIYIGLFAAWGLSVRQRIVQKQVCRFRRRNTCDIVARADECDRYVNRLIVAYCGCGNDNFCPFL